MREVRDLAAGMREAIAAIKKSSADAKGGLAIEMDRAKVNADKIKTFTQELKEANLEVEAFLGETGSNFPTSEVSDTQQQTDINGVTLNQEAAK